LGAPSAVLSDQMKGKGTWVEVDSTLYDPIAQGAVILKYGKDNNPESARKLFEFLYSAKARGILAKFGYRLP
jgi:molybdate transport system substrate-binding protein